MAVLPVGKPAWSRLAAIGDYGGATDKRDSATEGTTPYAWGIYQELTAALGSAFSAATTGMVHALKCALARSQAAVARAAEKLTANARPGTADELLGHWVRLEGITVKESDEKWQVRQRAAAKFQATKGPTAANVDAAIETLLGDYYVRSWRLVGADLATPPTPTYWPGVNPGPAAYNLGGGTWSSISAHLIVEVTQPSTGSLAEFLDLMNVQLFQLLDRTLEAYATFDWGVDVSSGFLLDIDQLDFGAFGA